MKIENSLAGYGFGKSRFGCWVNVNGNGQGSRSERRQEVKQVTHIIILYNNII
jgi:hypothetical protein